MEKSDADADDPTVECDGTFEPTLGSCQVRHHTHCPYCREQYGCRHFLAGWNDDVGLYEVEPPRLYDEMVGDLLTGDWRAVVPADLHDLLAVYADDGSPIELLDEALLVAAVDADRQRWEMLDRMPAGFGYAWYVPDAAAARDALMDVWKRVEAAFTTLESRTGPGIGGSC